MSIDVPRLLPNGDTAISVDFGNRIDLDLNARVQALDAALRGRALPYVIETVPTYRALMVHFDPLTVDYLQLCALLLELAELSGTVPPPKRRRWSVPVVYGGDFGEDLHLIAAHANLDPESFVSAHMAKVYSVMMIGFLPGFCYLAGLEPQLAMPRREQPRPRVPASSISIGGAQTAIGSMEGPSGWHLIGRTPVRPFLVSREPTFLFEAGDEIVFRRIPPGDWESLCAAAESGDPVATLVDE